MAAGQKSMTVRLAYEGNINLSKPSHSDKPLPPGKRRGPPQAFTELVAEWITAMN